MSIYESLDDFDRKTRSGIVATLYDGEEFLGAIDCRDVVFFRSRRATKLILTNRRIIAFKRGFIRQKSTDYDLDRISSVSFKKGFLLRKLAIQGSGIEDNFYVDPHVGRKFASAVRSEEPQEVFGYQSLDSSEISEASTTTEPVYNKSEPVSSPDVDTSAPPTDIEDSGTTTYSEKWSYAVLGSVILWILLFPMVNILGDSLVGLLSIVAWILLPISIYFDARFVRDQSEWSPRIIFWIIGSIIWLVNIAVGLYYLYQRRNALGVWLGRRSSQAKK